MRKSLLILPLSLSLCGCGVRTMSAPSAPDHLTLDRERGHFVSPYEGQWRGRAIKGIATFDDYPTEGFENRFGFHFLTGFKGEKIPPTQTWVLVANTSRGMRIRAEGIFDLTLTEVHNQPLDAFEDLWQSVRVSGARVLIEERKGEHYAR